MVSPGFLLSLAIGLTFLAIGLYTWKSPEVSLFRSANVIDKEVGGSEPSPPERVIAKIAGLTLTLLGLGWLYVMVWL